MTRILIFIGLVIVLPAWANYEQPNFEVVLEEGRLAIRDYPSVMVIETRVSASRSDAAGYAFRRLFKYISGENEAGLKIPMTAPVAQTMANGRVKSSDYWAVRFFLPNNLSEEDIPRPLESKVLVAKLKAQRYATVSFKGTQTDKKIKENMVKLESFLISQGYEVSGSPVYAFYDPPFIPWFLRDNEILLPVKKAEE